MIHDRQNRVRLRRPNSAVKTVLFWLLMIVSALLLWEVIKYDLSKSDIHNRNSPTGTSWLDASQPEGQGGDAIVFTNGILTVLSADPTSV
jgi:hypothetical protein